MMAERHYDDEALISLMETGRAGSDAHLPACKTCSEKMQSFRGLSGVLRDASVWDRKPLNVDPVPSTIANLRAFADRMSAEDTRAESYLNDLLAGSREEWMPRLQQHPEYRTAGMVRKLIAASDRAIDTMPRSCNVAVNSGCRFRTKDCCFSSSGSRRVGMCPP